MSKQIEITAQVTGGIRQQISLEPAYDYLTAEDVTRLLSTGAWMTTISHAKYRHNSILSLPDLKVGGLVLKQDALDDMEITDFEPVLETK